MTERNKKNYIAYADILRIVAAFSVVLLHVSGARIIREDIGSPAFLWAAGFDCAMRWSVPVFVMLSGMLFLSRKKSIDIKTLYTKNILRIVTAFVFWSYVYNLYTAFGECKDFPEAAKTAFFRIPNGAMHTWFLFVIAGLYVVLPFIKRMTDNLTKREAEYFIALNFIITFLPKTLSSFECCKPFLDYITKFEINYAAGYVGLFVAGWYINKFDHKKAFRVASYIGAVAGFLYMFYTTVYFSETRGFVADEFMSFKSIGAFMMAFGIFMFFKSFLGKRSFSRKTKANLAFYSKYTFGIYLVHELLLNISTAKGWFVLESVPYVGMPLEAIVVFVISAVIAGLITWLPFGKYIA